MPSNRPVIAVRVDRQLYDKVAALAKEEGRSLSNFVEILVRKTVDRREKKPA